MTLTDLIDFDMLSLDVMIEKIKNGENFSFARYGDGEFVTIFQDANLIRLVGLNCDGHPYYPDMGNELGAILANNPPYYIGMHQDKKTTPATLEWLENNGLMVDRLPFAANAVFHDAVIGKKRTNAGVEYGDYLPALWEALNTREVSIIAPVYVLEQPFINNFRFITIPGQNTYLHLQKTKEELKEFDFTGEVVLICASMCAPILVDYLYNQYGDRATFIDFGSTFDKFLPDSPFTRSFHQKIKL